MIVIIGATSFIGSYLVEELISQRREIFATGYQNLNEEFYSSRGITCCRLDLTNRLDFNKLPGQDIEAVILMGGLMPANDNDYKPELYIDVNIQGTLNTLEYCRRVGAGKIIFASSHSDVAGLWNCGRAITETDERTINYTGDHAVYIISNIAAMDLVEHYDQQFGLPGISFRLPAVYGFGPHTEIFVDGKPVVTGVKTFIQSAIASKLIEIWGNPENGRDIVYVRDVVNAFIGAVDSESAQGLYNIASGVRTTLEEEVRGIIDVFSPPDRPSSVSYNPEKPSIPTYLYDISKAKRDLGYEVQYPYREMLKDIKLEMDTKRFEHLIRREQKVLN